MNIEKHKNFVQEMMVTFSGGKVDELGNPIQPEQSAEPIVTVEPTVQATDAFNNSVNDMIKDFTGVNDMVSPATPYSSVETLSPETSDVEMEVENNQIGFELVDGKLHISIDGTDVYLSKDAIVALKDYLNNFDESDFDQPEEGESDESDDDSDDDSDDESEEDSEDDSEEDEKKEEE